MTRIYLILMSIFAVSLSSCSQAAPADPVPEHETLRIASEVLGEERVINVWLPPQYSAQGEGRFPVLYMPDGGVKEDFPHIANTLAELIADGRVSPAILVGIENTERRRDLTPASTADFDKAIAPQTDGARAFRRFIADELIPEIEDRYRTDGRRAIIGESAAGLFVIDSFFRSNELFQTYIAFDPALYWNDRELVRMASDRLGDGLGRGTKLWFAASSASDIEPPTKALARVFEQRAAEGLEWRFVPRPQDQHSTIFRATKAEAMQWALWKDKPATSE